MPSGAQGAFDWDEWGQLVRIVDAGVHGDAATFRAQLLDLERAFPMSGRSGAYLWYSLRYEVAKRLQRQPSEDDLALLATEIYPHFQTLITTERDVLWDPLRSCSSSSASARRSRPAEPCSS